MNTVRLLRTAAIGLALALCLAPSSFAQNPFAIDGTITDANNSGIPGALKTLDPHNNSSELGPINGSTTKIGVINRAAVPMLGFTSQPDKVDLKAVWTQVAMAVDGHQWFYFAWSRDSKVGSGFIAIEIQQAAAPDACVYEGVDQTSPTSAADLIAGCNPWANRQAGDFILLWDQQGNSTDIYKRVFEGTAPNLTLGAAEVIGTAVAKFSSDNYSGEAAIDLTADIFPPDAGCVNFANTIAATVTGNSDTADYKDTVLAAFPPMSNCGSLDVTKYTLDPSGLKRFSGTGTFPYTLARSGDQELRYAADVEPGDSLTKIEGTLTGDGDKDTHLNLIAGTNYTLGEGTIGAQWTLVSIACTVGSGTTPYSSGSIPVVINEVTHCIITTQIATSSPAGTTTQWVKLFDKITITGINTSAASPASSVTFRLYSDDACSTQLGNDITANLTYDGTSATADTSASGGVVVNAGGTYYWRVTYPGDTFNNGFTTTCKSESTTVAFSQ